MANPCQKCGNCFRYVVGKGSPTLANTCQHVCLPSLTACSPSFCGSLTPYCTIRYTTLHYCLVKSVPLDCWRPRTCLFNSECSFLWVCHRQSGQRQHPSWNFCLERPKRRWNLWKLGRKRPINAEFHSNLRCDCANSGSLCVVDHDLSDALLQHLLCRRFVELWVVSSRHHSGSNLSYIWDWPL